jgi:hypothetical protein
VPGDSVNHDASQFNPPIGGRDALKLASVCSASVRISASLVRAIPASVRPTTAPHPRRFTMARSGVGCKRLLAGLIVSRATDNALGGRDNDARCAPE